MELFAINCQCSSEVAELLGAELFELNCNGIEETENGITAYYSTDEVEQETVKDYLNDLQAKYSFSYELNSIKNENWNSLWESNYQPILIDDFCFIYAPFHESKQDVKHNILIDPKMAFGTGHHATTELMIRSIQTIGVSKLSVLDLGCGTGILAVVALKEGAKKVFAIDIDPISIDHLPENFTNNEATAIEFKQGTIEDIEQQFDVILANINRNVLLDDCQLICKQLNENGFLSLSGFYEEDIKTIVDTYTNEGLTFLDSQVKNKWGNVIFKKIGKIIEQ